MVMQLDLDDEEDTVAVLIRVGKQPQKRSVRAATCQLEN